MLALLKQVLSYWIGRRSLAIIIGAYLCVGAVLGSSAAWVMPASVSSLANGLAQSATFQVPLVQSSSPAGIEAAAIRAGGDGVAPPARQVAVTPVPGVDLVIESFTYAGGSAVPIDTPIGSLLTLRIRNAGSQAASGFFIALYISDDPVITNSDTLLREGRQWVDRLEAGQSLDVNLTNPAVPASIPPVPAYLGVIVDESDFVREADETNNTAVLPVTLVTPTTVVNTDDSGPGSLRQAILYANTHPGTDVIVFNIGCVGVFPLHPALRRSRTPTQDCESISPISVADVVRKGDVPIIRLQSPLPEITDPVVIDGTTQPGSGLVQLDGTDAGAGANGLLITAGNSTVRGLIINRFQGHGIVLARQGGNVIQENYIGVNVSVVATDLATGNAGDGIHIRDGSQGNRIGPGNIIAHNGGAGVRVAGATAVENTITRNSIYSNSGPGIENVEGGNRELRPPRLVGAAGNMVAGLAPPMSVVELFGDRADEGHLFLGQVEADALGRFHFSGELSGVNITATATDEAGNTSEFSDPVIWKTECLDTFELNDRWTLAYPISAGEYVSYICRSDDVDFYKLPVPERGSTVVFTLTNLPADFDLLLFGPTQVPSDTPIKDIPIKDIPIKDIPIKDIPIKDIPIKDIPIKDIPIKDIPIKDIPIKDIPIKDISFRRGTEEEQVSDVVLYTAGYYYLAVVGYEGVHSAEPYTLRVEVLPPPPPRVCSRTLPNEGTAGMIYQPFSSTESRTLILTNKQRIEELYGSVAANNLMAKLQEYAEHPTVKGMVLPVETDPAVAEAYRRWDENICDPEAANEVAGAIKYLLSSFFDTAFLPVDADTAFPNLTYLVIVGGDEVVPFRRVLDIVYTSNEYEYRYGAHVREDSALFASLEGGYIWTDDFYVDFEPTDYGGRPLYVANYPVGRLVETPEEIIAQLEYYLANDGVINATTSLVTGYDFLTDGSQIISDTLVAKGLNNDALISDDWDDQDLINNFLNMRHDINAINAHFDHWRTQPADIFSGLIYSDMLDQTDVLTGTVNFSMGCHAGLNVCDFISTGNPAGASLDFPQVFGRKRAVFVGNTGYGYGDTDAPTLSEEIMGNFARNLGEGGMTVGQALVKAKQDYALNGMGSYGPYDEKVLIEATLYGPPTYQVVVPTPGRSQTRDLSPLVARSSPLRRQNELIVRTYTITPTLTLVETPQGTYYVADSGIQAVLYRPVQPRVSLDIALSDVEADSGAVAHGALFLSGSYTDVPDFDPFITMPMTETTRYEPQWIYTGWRPQDLVRINHFQTPQGMLERLVLILGQFRHTSVQDNRVIGVQRLYNRVTYEVYYSTSDDVTPPAIRLATIDQQGDAVRFIARVRDASGVERVVATYTNGSGTWQSLDLTYVPETNEWVGELTGLTGEVVFMIQAVDGAGNVGVSRAKGLYFAPVAVEAGSDLVVDEGDEITFHGSGPDVSTIDVSTTVLWDFGDGLAAASTYTPVHRYRDNGQFEVNLRVTDEQGRTGVDSLLVTVNNVSPTLSIDEVGSPLPGLLCGEAITLTAGFTDPGVLDTHFAVVNWGDGVAEIGVASQDAGAGTISSVHTYTTEGTFTVRVCAVDDDGGYGCDAIEVTVRTPDVDTDGDVDIVDIMEIVRRWGDGTGASYGARYDLDGDGDIDLVDVQRAAARWHVPCSPDQGTRTSVKRSEISQILEEIGLSWILEDVLIIEREETYYYADADRALRNQRLHPDIWPANAQLSGAE